MKNIVKSAAVVGQVINLLIGNKFTTPANNVLENNPYIALY
ncbi:MAG: hypothetical protein Q8O43_10335 [Dehalococcoidia bacterium]|nr:hypothetical protein [Dehalococcoidia bacterium]